jgi:hypothetical protein
MFFHLSTTNTQFEKPGLARLVTDKSARVIDGAETKVINQVLETAGTMTLL